MDSKSQQIEREPKRIHTVRRYAYWLVPILYFAYIVYLIHNLVTDTYILKTDHFFLKEIDVPDILICGSNDMIILRCDFMWKNGTKTQIDNCNDYIVPAPSNLGSFRNYCHTFTTNQTLKYAHPYESEDGVTKIGIYLQIPNVTAAEQSAIGIAALNMLLTTPTFNPLTHPEEVVNQMDEYVKSEMTLQWNFLAGMVDYAAVIKFRINEYRAILPRDISAIIGFGANYHITPIIDNTVTYFPFNTNPYGLANGTNVYFSVAAGSFVQTQETEERTITILSAIASAGGAFGIIGGAYVLFFGQARMDAWGIAHKFSKEPAELVGASLFRSPSQDNVFNNDDNSQADLNLQIKQLGNDISELKEVIRCYVLDTSYLKEGPCWFSEKTRKKMFGVFNKVLRRDM